MTADPMNREIIDLALSDAARVYALTEDLDRHALLRLTEVFGDNLLYSAFRIVQKGFVKRLVAKNSRRTVTQVLSSSTTGFYIIFSSSNRCSCKAWQFRTWQNLGRMGPANAAFAFTCKHVLAARLAERVITDKMEERLMEEDMFVSTVAEIQ